MEREIYKRLANHLDNLPGGFPPTENGVEMRILKRLFTPEEAQLAVHLTMTPEDPQSIAGRIKLPGDETAQRLEEMAKKGLILRWTSETGSSKYMVAQYDVGVWEYYQT